MRRIIFIFLTSAAVSTLNAQTPTKGIFVLPAIIDFNLATSQVGNKTLTIQNRTDAGVQLRVYLSDWKRDSLGKHQYSESGTLANSCAQWINIDKTFIEVPSGATIPLNVTLKIPDSATSVKEMKWAMVFIEVVTEKKAMQDTGVSTAVLPIFRMGVHVYQTPPNLGKKELKMLSFDKVFQSSDSTVYSINCENVGDVHVRVKSSLELTNLTDGTKTKLGPDPVSIFPGARRRIYYKLPATLPKGKYSLLAVLDGGDDMPVEAAQTEIEIKKQ